MGFQCNEGKPICHNCERHQLPCVYDRDGLQKKRPTSSKPSNKSPPTSSPGTRERSESREGSTGQEYFGTGAENDGSDEEDPPESRARRMLEVKLMHQYVTETGSSIAIDDVSRNALCRMVPELACQSDALLYSMYTIAALHLVKLGKDAGLSLEGVADKYFSMAIREHKKELAQISRETVDVVCLTSCLIRTYASIQLQDRPRHYRQYTPPWEWLVVTKSSTTIFEEAWRLVGIEPQSVAFQLIKNSRHIHSKERQPGQSSSSNSGSSGSSGRRRLSHLMDRSLSESDGAPDEPWDADTQAVYEKTLDSIGDVLDAIERDGPSGNVCRMLIMFPMLAEKKYIDLVRVGSPRALVILAHYFALLAEYHQFWWIGQSGVKEVRSIADELTGKWHELMEWPLRMIDT